MTWLAHRQAMLDWWTLPTPRRWKALWLPWLLAVAILIAMDIAGDMPAWADEFPNPLLWYALGVTVGSWCHMYVIAYRASAARTHVTQESGEVPERS